MKKVTSRLLLILSLVAVLLFSACGNASSSTGGSQSPAGNTSASTDGGTTLIVGASPAPHAEILEHIIPVLAEQGITLEIREFDDYVLPNTALHDGDLDANYFQHGPYLEVFNAENNTDLVSAGDIHFEPLGIYPGRTEKLEDIADGAVIGVPNDTSNEARALYLLEAQGLITLKEGVGFEATPDDILENPHNLEFLELEAATLPSSLPDLDFAVINGNYALGSGLGDTKIASEDNDEALATYSNILCVRNGDESRPEIQALLAALQSDDTRAFIEERYGDNVVPAF